MSSSFGPSPFQGILIHLRPTALSDYASRRMPPPLVPPSADGILRTLSPTDAHVFSSALANVPLISHTPPFVTQLIAPPVNTPPGPVAALHAKMLEFGSAVEATHANLIREQPVACYSLFMLTGGILGSLGRVDDIRYAARAALRFTREELDDEMHRSILGGATWETFRPLVSYRLACMVALMPLIDLGPPPAEVVSGYAWTWRTCATCVEHVGHAPGDLWKELVATLRASPDPDAVMGVQHLWQALQGAMGCSTCSKVAYEHLTCFQGLLVVEAAKRIAEVSFEL
ncbi:hypothetical protein LXA43DRAFT_1149203 [Ganoderma leucocontextum]|nr:hypothetical protein LXA43DRAFT_1149203 [Ganoderma leucocontextum]